MKVLGFLASNNGTSFRAVVRAIDSKRLNARAALLVSNRSAAPALSFARERGIDTLVIPTLGDPAGADAALAGALRASSVELVLLSGYLRPLGPLTLSAYQDRILNVHPALLPSFGGKGMYGRHVHQAVIAARQTRSGASIHIVDGQYDHGAVLARAEILVDAGETPETLERKVMALEPELLIDVLQRLDRGVLKLPQ